MERSVTVLHCKRTGNFILHPMGSFRGYGGYVGINPYREVTSDAPPETLGHQIAELLESSGPTGVHIREHDTYEQQSGDDETRKIRTKYRLEKGRTTAKIAQRFVHAGVVQRPGQKSWTLQKYAYDSRLRSLSGEKHKPVRVKQSEGVAGLGRAVQELMLGKERK